MWTGFSRSVLNEQVEQVRRPREVLNRCRELCVQAILENNFAKAKRFAKLAKQTQDVIDKKAGAVLPEI